MNDINAKFAKIFGFPENTTQADIRIRPGRPPEIELRYMIIDSSGIPKEMEGKFKLVEVDSSED